MCPMLVRVIGHVQVLHQILHAAVIRHGPTVAEEDENHSKLHNIFLPLQGCASHDLVCDGVTANCEEQHFVLEVLAV
jgi:hypothetical protein